MGGGQSPVVYQPVLGCHRNFKLCVELSSFMCPVRCITSEQHSLIVLHRTFVLWLSWNIRRTENSPILYLTTGQSLSNSVRFHVFFFFSATVEVCLLLFLATDFCGCCHILGIANVLFNDINSSTIAPEGCLCNLGQSVVEIKKTTSSSFSGKLHQRPLQGFKTKSKLVPLP